MDKVLLKGGLKLRIRVFKLQIWCIVLFIYSDFGNFRFFSSIGKFHQNRL